MSKPYKLGDPWVRECLNGILPEQRARWDRRAQRIEKIARRMMAEAIDQTNLDHPLTDEIDNVLHAVEDLIDALASPRSRKRFHEGREKK